MCLYDPPLFLGTPDLSAAMFCAVPLAASATRPRELLTSFIGLAAGFLAAHFFIVALHHLYPPSVFYWMDEQAGAAPLALGAIAFELIVLYGISHFVRGLWRGEYLQAAKHLLLALALLAAAIGAIAYLILDARALESSMMLSVINTNSPEPVAPEDLRIADCMFPPFGEGVTGYAMLAALVIFQILVAVGVADVLNRKVAPNAAI